MFLRERQDTIVELIRAEGRVTVSDLASRFGVTEGCIRKDLKQLDVQGALKRVYGAAISATSVSERNVSKRASTLVSEKRAIAEKAYEQIDAGETLFLDVSTTALAIAELLVGGQARHGRLKHDGNPSCPLSQPCPHRFGDWRQRQRRARRICGLPGAQYARTHPP